MVGGKENPGPAEICIAAVSTGYRVLRVLQGYRRNVSASLLVRERSCTRYAAGLSTPKVRLMEAGLDRVRSSPTVILPSENCVLAEQNNRSS